jgi:O-glycosyl hydrolase
MNRIARRTSSKATSVLVLAMLFGVSQARAAEITIDARTTFQRMDGFGTSERVFDDPHIWGNRVDTNTGRAAVVLTAAQQDEILDQLYVNLKLTRVRPAQPDTSPGSPPPGPLPVEPQNDNADPNVIDWSKFDFTWKRLDAHVDYLSRARQRGVSTYFLSPVFRESWMGTTTTNDAAEYAEWLLAQTLRCQTLGVTLPYLSVANEPSYSRNTLSGPFVRDVIKILGPKLRAAGLPTFFVVPDDLNPATAYNQSAIVLADPEARQYVGALATHLYGGSDLTNLKTLAASNNLPVWMTEYFLDDPFAWAGLMHNLIATYNVSAVDYMWGYSEGTSANLIQLNFNTNTFAYLGYTLRKHFYVVGQFSKFVAPGAIRIRADSNDNHAKVTAYVDWPNFTIVAFNESTTARIANFTLAGLPSISTFNAVRTSATENSTTLAAVPVSGLTFTANLPGQSITTFTAALPPLKLELALSNDTIVLSWPVAAADFKPEESGQLTASNSWLTITNTVSVSGDRRSVTLTRDPVTRFYRLSAERRN